MKFSLLNFYCYKQIPKQLVNFSLVLLLFLSSPAVSAEKDRLITVNQVNYRNHVLSLKHNSFGDIKFKKRIYTEPARLVFDILGAKLSNNKTFRFEGITGEVTSVRVAQFEDNIVRVVCEANSISALEKIKIENLGQTLYFKFQVRNVRLTDVSFSEGDLRIVADGPMVPRTILLDNPERLVLDLIGAQLKSKAQERNFKNGEETIRVAQFDQSIVRVVFTGRKAHSRDVRISSNEKQLLVLGKEHKDKKSKFGNAVVSLKLVQNTPKESLYYIRAEEELNYKFMKLHFPERLVLDLVDTQIEDSFGSEPLPETNQVKNIRFGLATIGRPVTRIVFDMKSNKLSEEFRETDGGKGLYIKFSGQVSKNDITPARRSMGAKVVLDAGHGGYDSGATYGGHEEKDITLSITKKVKNYLSEAGISAYMTRTEDRFISLAERVEISNAINPKIFVSIHANALVTNRDMQGLQTYHYSDNGYKLATYTHKQMVKDVGMPDRRIRKARFWVCKYTRAPSVLIETGFMTNSTELKKLVRDSYQDALAKAITRGIIEYLEDH